MSSSHKCRQILAIIQTDSTFEQAEWQGRRIWVGKCIHCAARLMIDIEGHPINSATIEHIVPRTNGGTDALENLALACARCNAEKGVRHDRRHRTNARAQEVVEQLKQKRVNRWRHVNEG